MNHDLRRGPIYCFHGHLELFCLRCGQMVQEHFTNVPHVPNYDADFEYREEFEGNFFKRVEIMSFDCYVPKKVTT